MYQDKEFAMEEMKKYNNFLSLLDEFLGPDEEDVEPLNDININTILKDSIQDTIAPEE